LGHLIRYYGLYSSRTKGKAHKDGSLAKYGYRAKPKKTTDKLPDIEMQSVSNKTSRRSWARLIQKVYEVDPLVCPKCGSVMPKMPLVPEVPVVKVVAVITDPSEVNKILECLKRNNAPPFDKGALKAS
jgi:hypothetical protein